MVYLCWAKVAANVEEHLEKADRLVDFMDQIAIGGVGPVSVLGFDPIEDLMQFRTQQYVMQECPRSHSYVR